MKSQIFFLKQLPSFKFLLSKTSSKQALVFCDKKLKNSLLLKKWEKNSHLTFYNLNSGEKTKSLEHLPKHLQKINSLIPDFDKNLTLFIGLGGGSLLDLTGFIASIYKRGVPFVAIPSTYLSAIDSAHGGKNALNFKKVKNLIGTYHFPQAVLIIKELLKNNPEHLKESAYGELLKIALIEGGLFYKKLHSHFLKSKQINIYPFLKQAIKAKMKIVAQDPFEKKSFRLKLNLGHSLGHILEAYHFMDHGRSVLYGLLFSLRWSYHKKFLNLKNFKEIKKIIPIKSKLKKIPLQTFIKYLRQDKKHKRNEKLNFIFIKKPGQVLIKTISEKEMIQEAKRQSLIKNV
ncbi:MAG: iron-containing alcohol dehydrogenase [Bdellovibrionales bacterium]|nr:iron-containing alcohol dehydrogenase [Bdellovibrionales bacterium]